MTYLRARYYNPQIGRFTSLDIEEGEISNPLDMNRYVYCRNNPIKYVDPTGMSVYGYGFTASAAVFLGLEGQILWVTDDYGNFALMTVSGGINSIGISLGGIAFVFPEMPNLKYMEGSGFGLNLSIGNSGGGIVTAGNYEGVAYTMGVGAEADVSISPDITYTYITPIRGNINEIGNWLKKTINLFLPKKWEV